MDPITTAPLAATVTVGVPEGLDIEAVRKRKALLLGAGVDPLLAEGLAISAETQQALLDIRTAEGLKRDADMAKQKATQRQLEADQAAAVAAQAQANAANAAASAIIAAAQAQLTDDQPETKGGKKGGAK